MPRYTILSVHPARDPLEIDTNDVLVALRAVQAGWLGVVDILEDGYYMFSCDTTLDPDWKIFRRRWV